MKKYIICRNVCYVVSVAIFVFFITASLFGAFNMWNDLPKYESFGSFSEYYLSNLKAPLFLGLSFGAIPLAVGLWAHWELITIRKGTSN